MNMQHQIECLQNLLVSYRFIPRARARMDSDISRSSLAGLVVNK